MTKRIVWVLGLTVAVFLALGLLAVGTLRLSNSRTYQLFGDLVTRVETSDSVVALTFDDGPHGIYTDSVLATLNEFQVPATFFMVGEAVRRHPEVVARVVALGSEVANHSLSHRPMILMAPGTVREEVEVTDSLIRAAGRDGDIYFRPPYGKRLVALPLYLARHRRPTVLWSLEPDTYHRRAEDISRYVMDHVTPGAIILLHVEMPARAEGRRALRQIIVGLRAAGYRFATLYELMALQDGAP